MGTKKGQVRKTARRAYEPRKVRTRMSPEGIARVIENSKLNFFNTRNFRRYSSFDQLRFRKK